jgi:hypothetical protein
MRVSVAVAGVRITPIQAMSALVCSFPRAGYCAGILHRPPTRAD